MTFEMLRELLQEHQLLAQVNVQDHKLFKIAIGGVKDDGSPIGYRNMMLVQFADLAQAVMVLCTLDGSMLSERKL